VSAILGFDRLGSGTRPADNGLYRSGEVIAGRYVVRELIGVGPLGMVYRTENRQSGGVVALRVIWPDLLTDDASRGRFLRECIRARTVQHRYVAPLYEAFIDDSSGQAVCVLAVKHLGGPTLASRVARRLQAGVPLLALEAQPIVSQIGVGLSAIHQAGLVHGNLRSTSIYFAGDEIRVSDLGVASALPAEIVALAEQHAGKASGRSPEAAAGRRSSPASDVYAFAHLTGQMLGLLSPRSRDEVPVPRSVRAVLTRALSPNPRDRYADVDTFAGALVTAFERVDQRSAVGLRAVAPPTGETTPKIRTFRTSRSEPSEGSEPPSFARRGSESVAGALETRSRPSSGNGRRAGAPASVVIDQNAMYSETPATLPPISHPAPIVPPIVSAIASSIVAPFVAPLVPPTAEELARQPPIPLRNVRRPGHPHPVPHPSTSIGRAAHAPQPQPQEVARTATVPRAAVVTPASLLRSRTVARVPLALVLSLTIAATSLAAAVVRNIVTGKFEERIAEERIAKAELLRRSARAVPSPPAQQDE
jgi:serine/threonine protein kinase